MFSIDLTNAEDTGEIIQVFAEYKIVPKISPLAKSDVAKSRYIFERRGQTKPGGKKHLFGAQTRKKMIKQIGVSSDKDCKRLREEIKNHPDWGDKI